MTHIVVDPVTRIEGHLRVEAEVDGGSVTEAWSSSTMFRGIELILRGRDPVSYTHLDVYKRQVKSRLWIMPVGRNSWGFSLSSSG